MERPRKGTATSAFGSGRREGHDSSAFYDRFPAPDISDDDRVVPVPGFDQPRAILGDSRGMHHLPDNCVALVVTSPPYFVGKEYEKAVAGRRVPESYMDYLGLLREVFTECVRVLEPGGRMAVNVANLGRKPYRSLSADVTGILQDDLGLLLRGEIVWTKAKGAGGSCAWGSWRSPANPVLRDLTERVVIASKGRFDRALSPAPRAAAGLPHRSTISREAFMEATLDVWEIRPESATQVGHPAPFPVELPRRLIQLYTYEDDLVLDPFMGSGTTLVAAAATDRRGVGYDIDPAYVELARTRLADLEQPTSRPIPTSG
ncbi:MAG: site-specific DNA-methyltransferase [Acidimicrobiia bacterium]|nr:site-specific DNA-methyltransferase [Acidimicrobiia bacterium]